VIHLVLKDPRLPALDGPLGFPERLIEVLHGDLKSARHLGGVPLIGEAALFSDGNPLAAGDDRIDDRAKFGGFQIEGVDEKALLDPDLGGGQADAAMMDHRLEHIGQRLIEVLIEELDGRAVDPEIGVLDVEDRQQCHGRSDHPCVATTGRRRGIANIPAGAHRGLMVSGGCVVWPRGLAGTPVARSVTGDRRGIIELSDSGRFSGWQATNPTVVSAAVVSHFGGPLPCNSAIWMNPAAPGSFRQRYPK